MSDDPGQSAPAHVIAMADQIHAAIRDKDSDRLTAIIRGLSRSDPAAVRAARAMLIHALRQTTGNQDGDDPPPLWRQSLR